MFLTLVCDPGPQLTEQTLHELHCGFGGIVETTGAGVTGRFINCFGLICLHVLDWTSGDPEIVLDAVF